MVNGTTQSDPGEAITLFPNEPLVEDHRGDTFRAVYIVRIGDAVHVLHAFQKKSKSGIATPQPDVELIEKRLKAVLARYGVSGRT